MSAYAYEARTQFTGLLAYQMRPPLYYLWIAKERWPAQFGWFWRMVHVSEWQKSTAQSVSFWLLATFIIYKMVSRLGHGWQLNIAVSIGLDWLGFGINRLWVWKKRAISLPGSTGRNAMVWGVTFGLNVLMAWLIISRVGLLPGRALLGCYGIAANPVLFKVRNGFVFDEGNFKEIAAARCRMELCQAVAAGHLAFLRTTM